MTTLSGIPIFPPQPALSEQRVQERASLLLRTAKLICQTGEYACLVRDVSETGVKLRLFHALPDETFVFLSLANGEVFPVERMWTRDNEVGFRFTQPIDVDAFVAERSSWPRRPLRLKIKASGLVFSGSTAMSIGLKDLSQGGARIEAYGHMMVHQGVRINIDLVPERRGRIAWRRGFEHGIVFEQPFKLDELASYALRLQPLDAPVVGNTDVRYA